MHPICRYIVLLLFILFLSEHASSQERILFASQPNSTTSLQSWLMTNKSSLFITIPLEQPLTRTLQQLGPDLPIDTLHKQGGFQFNLLIDNHLIYSSDILGAPLPPIKDSATTLDIPLINNQDHDWALWSEFYWMRFMRAGGDSVLTEGPHHLRLEIRPYLHHKDKSTTGELLAAGDLDITVNRQPVIDLTHIGLNPPKPYPGLALSNEPFDTNKIKELKGAIDTGIFKKISSVIVLKNGRLLIEEYFNGEGRDSLHDPRSVGKSFASTMTGIAIAEGYLKSVEQPLKDFYNLKSFDHYSPEKENIPLKALLTMSSPFDGNDDDGNSPGNEENMYPTADWVKFTLDLPLRSPSNAPALSMPAAPPHLAGQPTAAVLPLPQTGQPTSPTTRLSQTGQPGSSVATPAAQPQWHYFTAGAMLMGDILNKSVPGGLEAYADKKLFAPLGIRDYRWQYTPQHVPNTAGGIRLKALDFAKYGQLYKNGGVWQNHRILPQSWVKKTFTRRQAIPGRSEEFYGYLFWNKKYRVRQRSYETFYCAGNGGNSIFVFLNQPLVIVITATAYGLPYAHSQVDKMMTDYILPAVIASP